MKLTIRLEFIMMKQKKIMIKNILEKNIKNEFSVKLEETFITITKIL